MYLKKLKKDGTSTLSDESVEPYNLPCRDLKISLFVLIHVKIIH